MLQQREGSHEGYAAVAVEAWWRWLLLLLHASAIRAHASQEQHMVQYVAAVNIRRC
jgi:hypothetical protein